LRLTLDGGLGVFVAPVRGVVRGAAAPVAVGVSVTTAIEKVGTAETGVMEGGNNCVGAAVGSGVDDATGGPADGAAAGLEVGETRLTHEAERAAVSAPVAMAANRAAALRTVTGAFSHAAAGPWLGLRRGVTLSGQTRNRERPN
jgi:hypothetical protein